MSGSEQRAMPRGRLRHNEPMAKHTSWRIGGPAERYYEPADLPDLCAFLSALPLGEPLLWMGVGSNLLVRDGGIRGTVLATSRALTRLAHVAPGQVDSGAGVACARIARFCQSEGLGGAEFLAGIPGTLGGALAMNAGAFGGETWDIVERVGTVNRSGEILQRHVREFQVGYRNVQVPLGEWFLGARLRVLPGEDPADVRARTRAMLAERSARQPLGAPSCGSVFRNPPGHYAAQLIEACGLKGLCVGKARVSKVHANFIVNEGGATASDVETLIGRVAAKVRERHGVGLELEVRVVGDPPMPSPTEAGT